MVKVSSFRCVRMRYCSLLTGNVKGQGPHGLIGFRRTSSLLVRLLPP